MPRNRKIFRYQIDATRNAAQNVPLPSGALILDVQFQGENLTLWAEVDPDSPMDWSNQVYLAFTGGCSPDGWTYFRTLQKHGFVLHVYMKAAVEEGNHQ